MAKTKIKKQPISHFNMFWDEIVPVLSPNLITLLCAKENTLQDKFDHSFWGVSVNYHFPTSRILLAFCVSFLGSFFVSIYECQACFSTGECQKLTLSDYRLVRIFAYTFPRWLDYYYLSVCFFPYGIIHIWKWHFSKTIMYLSHQEAKSCLAWESKKSILSFCRFCFVI